MADFRNRRFLDLLLLTAFSGFDSVDGTTTTVAAAGADLGSGTSAPQRSQLSPLLACEWPDRVAVGSGDGGGGKD